MSARNSSTKSTGIPKIQREIDSLKFKIDDLCENEIPSLGAASPDRLTVYQRANNLKENLDLLDDKLNTQSLIDQKVSTKRFDEQKKIEKNRILNLQKRLDDITAQLEPDEVEEDYFRQIRRKEHEIENTGDEDDDDDDDEYESDEDDELNYEEEEDDDDDEGEELDEVIIYRVEALSNFTGEQEDDLSFQEGDIIFITKLNDDGWWLGRDSKGNKGLVPSTLVKIVELEKTPRQSSKGPLERPRPLEKKRSGKELWAALRESKTSNVTSVTDVLQAMKAVPSGFRSSTLGKCFQKEEYKPSAWVIPKTSASNLQLKDLFWDGINKKIKTCPVKLCRTFSLMSVKCIPLVGAGVEIFSRHVYVSLWDQEKIISNIHVIRAVLAEKDMSWSFTPKIAKTVPSLYDGDLIARMDDDDRRISLLFELNYTYKRTSTGEKSEMSCGWGTLPLFDLEGAPVGNKNFEIKISGGTPFQKGIPLDSSLTLDPNQSLMQSLIRTNRQPRLVVKTTNYNKLTKDMYDMLPSTLITCQKYARFIGLYRQHASTLLCREDTIPSDLICDPIMTYFPRGLNFPDLMDSLKLVWDEKNKANLNRSQRRNLASLHSLFKECFMESVFSLMQCCDLPQAVWADEHVEQVRTTFISSFIQRRLPLGGLLSADYQFRPLNISKLAFDVISKNSQIPTPITRNYEREMFEK